MRRMNRPPPTTKVLPSSRIAIAKTVLSLMFVRLTRREKVLHVSVTYGYVQCLMSFVGTLITGFVHLSITHRYISYSLIADMLK